MSQSLEVKALFCFGVNIFVKIAVQLAAATYNCTYVAIAKMIREIPLLIFECLG